MTRHLLDEVLDAKTARKAAAERLARAAGPPPEEHGSEDGETT